jgi:hypothetical protein
VGYAVSKLSSNCGTAADVVATRISVRAVLSILDAAPGCLDALCGADRRAQAPNGGIGMEVSHPR